MQTGQMLVGDVMTMDPVVVNVDASLEEAAHLFRSNAISGLPVVDATGSLIGVISQTDLVGVMDSPLGRLIGIQPGRLRVGELMTSPAVTIPLTDSLPEAARVMLGSRVHRLVATDDDGRPVGVLSAIDFVALYADG
jgi:CBS domain-containing protein